MTERLYYNNSMLLEFDARIVESGKFDNRHYTVLDRSAFYPTSGGQSYDIGKLGELTIEEVIESSDGEVLHLSNEPVGKIGQLVHGVVNKKRRIANSQKHTAQHILSQAFSRLFGWKTVSVHLGEQYAAVELEEASITNDQLQAVEDISNEIVFANYQITIKFLESEELDTIPLRKKPKREGTLRIIIIGEYDYTACGGTHCSSTAEVGIIKIIGTEKMRGHILVKFLIGAQAFKDYKRRFEVTDYLSHNMTCGVDDIIEKTDKLVADNKGLKHQVNQLQKDILPIRVQSLVNTANQFGKHNVVLAVIHDLDSKLTSSLAIQVATQINGISFLLVDNRLIIATAPECNLHADNLVKQIGFECGLKGGGNKHMAQLGGAKQSFFEQNKKLIEQLVSNE
ncbi:MAG: DHHA1 domain-containing protein [candidate division Zixibacteria bacterium]|nr:DHHA1 domain-containing protein [candidate division Zixibacteria bacterium]